MYYGVQKLIPIVFRFHLHYSEGIWFTMNKSKHYPPSPLWKDAIDAKQRLMKLAAWLFVEEQLKKTDVMFYSR